MIHVSQFYARTFDLDYVDLFWEIVDLYSGKPTDDNILAYDFQVFRSESPMGPWDAISPKFQDQYIFRDTSPALLHNWRKLFYLLRVTDRRNNETKDFGPTAQLPEPDLIALEIMRQEDVLFREHVGRRCWVLPVRTFGQHCICFDRVLGKRTRANCVTCYDVGFLGGYLSPIECFIQIDPSGKNNQLGTLGELQAINTTGRLLAFPPLKPKDIIVESENRRWRINTVAYTARLRAVVHQELTLHEIPLGDVEYKIPILKDTKTLTPASERNFTNPQNPDGDDELQNIFAVYGYQPRGTVR